ncbi:MAG: OmpA family protein [Bacteroidaceae bacterium]|nr:OmpA family protein [Bacteroidaceae bacterium]
MNHIKKFSLLFTAFSLMAMGLYAQEEEKKVSYPQLFFGAQAGTQVTFTNYNNWELFTPTASFSFGSFFTPVVGARLHFNGAWNRGGYLDSEEDFRYKYKYFTSDIDMMVNLVTLIGKKEYYPVNVYLIGGVGFNYAWDNDEAYEHKDKLLLAYDDGRFSHNARIGAMVDCEISKHFSINLELSANTLKDRFNSKLHNKGDWQMVGQLGVTYKFAAKRGEKAKKEKVEKVQIEPAEVWETRQDTIWYDDVIEATKAENGTKTWTVFYDVSQTDFAANEQLASIGAFLKDYRDCQVDIKSYADAKTGNAQKNLELSKQRMEKAVKALTDAGVPASSITSNCYGDTIQPFAENDKNRVTIIVATGLKDSKDKKMVKKFKTKEVRYRVR